MADYNISQYKITTQDKQGKLVSELDDFPSLSASALKARFDALGVNLIIPRFNDMLDDLQLIVNALKGQEFHATRYALSVGSAATYVDITINGVDVNTPVVATNNSQTGTAATMVIQNVYVPLPNKVRVKFAAAPGSDITMNITVMHKDL